jgi:BirA family biotin operon repressor/biotin-[acetyl-CoA-carboxylase] ligase
MFQRERLLRALADGRFHSGAALGKTLGVGRSAVWKQVHALEALGLDVYAVRGKGYRLAAPVELLDVKAIRAALRPESAGRLRGLESLFEIDSTNSYLMARAAAGLQGPWLCLAESQSAGQGRRGRRWASPLGRNLYLSLLWRFELGAEALAGLSLVAGVAIAEALEGSGVEGVGLKWPNDLFHDDGKLGGLLIELAGEASGPWDAVIGVGLNIDMCGPAAKEVDQPWTDLRTAAGRLPGRNRIAALVIDALMQAMPRFEVRGFAPFRDAWERFDIARGRIVDLQVGSGDIKRGRARGVGEHGALLLECGGRIRAVSSGEISLRIAE